MITLKKNWTLQALMSGAANTTNPDYVVGYQDKTEAGGKNGTLDGTTAVELAPAPTGTEKRSVETISIYNADDANVTVTVRVADASSDSGTVYRKVTVITLATGETLLYDQNGWSVLDTTGARKTTAVTLGAVTFGDAVPLRFGDGNDITVQWDGTDLLVGQAAADSIVKWGVSGAGINHIFYGDTATRDMTWDQSNDQLLFADNAKLAIGSGAGAAGDITFSWNATKMLVGQLTANSAIDWGVDGAGIDQVWYGDTASTNLTWDQSADSLIFNGAARLVWTGTTGQGEIHLTDNLADALSIEISGSTDLMVFTTTDNAESVAIHGLRTKSTTAVAITGATALTLADSGGIFTVSQGAAYDIDLPSPTSGPGCRYFFSLTAPGANNVTITVLGGAATFVGSVITEGQIVVATGSTLTFASGVCVLGDSIEIQSIATNLYHVRAVSSILNGITIA